jgi:hypothetical protein
MNPGLRPPLGREPGFGSERAVAAGSGHFFFAPPLAGAPAFFLGAPYLERA